MRFFWYSVFQIQPEATALLTDGKHSTEEKIPQFAPLQSSPGLYKLSN